MTGESPGTILQNILTVVSVELYWLMHVNVPSTDNKDVCTWITSSIVQKDLTCRNTCM